MEYSSVPPPISSGKSVLILYCGGAIGMKYDANGSLAPAKGYLSEEIDSFKEFQQAHMPSVQVKEADELLDSSLMGPEHWAALATDIEENYYLHDGFVVIMGTDTMAYASSAMSFMLENLGKPVIFTGSTIPMVEVYSDARRNIISSVIFAASTTFNEVCICFNDKLLRANRANKVNSTGFHAFDSPNFPALATFGAFVYENRELALPAPKGRFRAFKNVDAHILVIRLVPGFDDEAISAVVRNSATIRGIILEMYGTGNGPSVEPLLMAIREARSKGIVTVGVTQCLRGGVLLTTYAMGKEYQDAGVCSGGNMTTACAFAKLAYLLGRIKDMTKIEHLMSQNLRGEITLVEESGKKYFEHPARL